MTDSYPLRWPDGWPKTPAKERQRGLQFRRGGYNGTLPTFSSGRKDVIEELARMGVSVCVISSGIDVRVDGVPRSGVNPDTFTLKEPGVALYFTHKGRPVTLAQDAFTSPGVNLRSLACCLEHLRGVERHGGKVVGARAFDGFAALPPPAGSKPKRPWWEVLKYPADQAEREEAFLSAAEVEARFRAMSKKLHPDAGGTGDAMAELSVARDEAVAELTGQGA